MKLQEIETVNILQAKEALAQSMQVYFAKDRKGRPLFDQRRARPLCLMGPPGIGKTEIVRQAAQEQGLAFLSYSITHHTRQSLLGLPRLVSGTVNGQEVSMTEYTMSEIVAEIYRTMERTHLNSGILFLDEFNCSSESIRPILLQLLQEKSFGPHPLPDGWMLVLAGNPQEYNRAAWDFDAVLADRVRMLHITPDYGVWRTYAKSQNIHPMVLTYLDNHKNHFYTCQSTANGTALVTARGWEDLSRMLSALDTDTLAPSLSLVTQYIQSGEIARGFFGWWSQYTALISSGIIDQVLSGAPEAVTSCSGLTSPLRWSLVSVLLHQLEQQAADVAEAEETLALTHEALARIKAKLTPAKASPLDLAEQISAAAEKTDDSFVYAFLSSCSQTAAQSGWEGVKAQFEANLRKPFLQNLTDAQAKLENTIAVARRAFKGKPELSFLLDGLSNSPALIQMLSRTQHAEFKELFQDTFFDPDTAASKLLRQINKDISL